MGLFDSLFKGKAGTDSGNAFAGDVHDKSQRALTDYLQRSHESGANEFLGDPVLGQLYKQGQGYLDETSGDLGRARSEEQNLASRGYSLQPEDYEAYGQASGNIARQFGRSEGNLASALAARGLGGAAAGRAFMTSQGNKMEQLAGMQRQIANDRMKSNMDRLAQTRNFMTNLNSQRAGQLGNQQGFAQSGINAKNEFAKDKAGMGQQNMNLMQQQANNNYAQQLASQKASPFKNILGQTLQAYGSQSGDPMMGALGGGLGEAAGSDQVDAGTGSKAAYGQQDRALSLFSGLMGGGGKK